MSSETSSDDPAGQGASSPSARSSLERSLELLWEGRPAPSKGPKPALSLDEIVEAAIELADADGLEALSMRRLARELGVGTMSLYRYVPDKRVLLDLMLDTVSAPDHDARPAPGRPWREVLEAEALLGRELYLRHPWVLQVNWTRPVLGPNTIAGLELTLAGLTELPLGDQDKIAIISAIDAYVAGSVRQQLMSESAAEDSGISDEEFWGLQGPALERAMESGDYPVLAELQPDAFDASWDATFEQGLGHLLDGIALEVGDDRADPIAGSGPQLSC